MIEKKETLLNCVSKREKTFSYIFIIKNGITTQERHKISVNSRLEGEITGTFKGKFK